MVFAGASSLCSADSADRAAEGSWQCKGTVEFICSDDKNDYEDATDVNASTFAVTCCSLTFECIYWNVMLYLMKVL